MEDKHIYSTSFWSKLQDRFNDFRNETKDIVQSLVPKRKKSKTPTVPIEPIKTEIPQTPVTINVNEIKTEKTQTKKPKEEKSKKDRVKKFHYRKMADERVQKMLVISLSTLMIGVFGLGIFLTYKDSLFPQNQQTKSQKQITSIPKSTGIWKTYTNPVFKFELKIPENFTVYEGSNYRLAIIENQQKEIAAPHEIESDIQIWINANRDGEYGNYNNTISNRTKSDRYPSKLQMIEKDKYILFSGWWTGPFSESNYYATEALIKYENGAISFIQQHEPNESTLFMEQILSTFKFIE